MDFETTTLPPRSVMPTGGGPKDDAAYLRWKAAWIAETNARLIDLHVIATGRLPDREPIDPANFDESLWLALGNTRWFEPPTYHHRLRALAISLRDDRRKLIRAATHHAAKCAARLEDTA